MAIGAGDFNQAINELKLRVASDAKDAESRILLARLIYWESKNVALASKYLDEAEAITPKSMAITAVRVSIMKSEGRQDDARKALDAEITRNPTFWAYFLRAAYLASLGDAASAEKDFVHLTTFKDEPRAYELLSKFYLDQKRVEDAIAVVQKGIEAYPEALPLKRDLMRMLFVRGAGQDRQQAADLLKELEVRLPDDPGLLWMHALVLLGEAKEESTRKAQELLERAVRLEATLVEGHLALVDLAMLRHDYAAARDLAIRALGSNPDSPRLLLARASAERLLNNPVMARELARAALKNDPDNLDAHTALTDIAIASRDTKALGELKTVLDAAIVRKPDADRLYLMRAALLDALGQTEAAGTSLEAFVQSEAGRRSTAAILALAEVYRVRGDAAKSAEKIKQAAAISPDNPEIVREQVLWLGTQKKLDEIVALTSA
ncbi:MAG: tetratricopeptide repeat protein, partial [Planctomycetota bacterium]|nr:tetratricopeptide repeat protein [Planctomycetota bacterium]